MGCEKFWRFRRVYCRIDLVLSSWWSDFTWCAEHLLMAQQSARNWSYLTSVELFRWATGPFLQVGWQWGCHWTTDRNVRYGRVPVQQGSGYRPQEFVRLETQACLCGSVVHETIANRGIRKDVLEDMIELMWINWHLGSWGVRDAH